MTGGCNIIKVVPGCKGHTKQQGAARLHIDHAVGNVNLCRTIVTLQIKILDGRLQVDASYVRCCKWWLCIPPNSHSSCMCCHLATECHASCTRVCCYQPTITILLQFEDAALSCACRSAPGYMSDCTAKYEARARGLTRRGKVLISLAKCLSAWSCCDMLLILTVKSHANPTKTKLKVVVVVNSSRARARCHFERCGVRLGFRKPSVSLSL